MRLEAMAAVHCAFIKTSTVQAYVMQLAEELTQEQATLYIVHMQV
jgi:hypothetical protein